VLTAEDGSYVFNVRPNRNYQILIEDGRGNKSKHDITASDYINQNYLSQNMNSIKVGGNDKNISSTNNGVNQQGNNGGNNLDKPSGDRTSISSTNPSGNLNNYNKDIGLINFVTPKPTITPPVEKPIVAKRTFISVVDSLQSVTKDYLLVHHEFDKVKIYKEDHEAYRDLVDRVRKLKGVKIVIVSATDCLGTDAYNEALSARRSHKIKVDLSRKGGNEIISIPVGEKQLVMECSATDKDKNKQVENRYSYIFIMNKN
jgi:outer membrane protein OmpA-like peptidoglycan-associated protein